MGLVSIVLDWGIRFVYFTLVFFYLFWWGKGGGGGFSKK